MVTVTVSKLRMLLLTLVAATLLLGVTGTASWNTTGTQFTETGVTVGDGNWLSLSAGSYTCYVWADAWTDGNVDVEWLVVGTTGTPTKVANVGVAALVNITADVYATIAIQEGFYRIEVEGSDTINWRCGRYAQ